MRLTSRIETELDRLASCVPGQGELSLSIEDGRLQASFKAVDQLACSLTGFLYAHRGWVDCSADELKRRATALAQKLNYLLEAISPIEIDREACVVQLRSDPPEKTPGCSKYYELVVSRDQTRLSRYAKARGQSRQPVPATITREVLVRLVKDITAPVD